jgi:translation initiation factor RLI1
MKPTLVANLIRRMRSTYAPVVEAAKRLTTKELVEQLEEKTTLVLGAIDEYAVAQAGLKDLSIAANILIEKQQLLTNKPTQILDVTTRMQVNGLLPMMIAEARRRGITVDGTAMRVVVSDEPR